MKPIVYQNVMFLASAVPFYVAADQVALSQETYKPEFGIVILQVNWGRTWKCGKYQNAQLQSLTFSQLQTESLPRASIDLETPSKLFVDDKYLPYALVVKPGEYTLTGFDVKVARSTSEVGHLKGSLDNLIKDGQPIGGKLTVKEGEIVYVGHFGLDCAAEPFLWRQYIQDRQDFERYVGGFRAKFPFVKGIPVQYQLFQTDVFGKNFSLANPTVE